MSQSRIERMLNEVRVTNYGKLAMLTIAAVAAAMIIVGTSMTSSELTAADKAQAPQTGDAAAPPQTGESTGYFPGQHVNQATEASEHIQGF